MFCEAAGVVGRVYPAGRTQLLSLLQLQDEAANHLLVYHILRPLGMDTFRSWWFSWGLALQCLAPATGLRYPVTTPPDAPRAFPALQSYLTHLSHASQSPGL